MKNTMKNIFPKWIFEDDFIVIRKCTFHKDIVENIPDVRGGGLFYFHRDTNTFILYGSSHDFGKANPEAVQRAIADGRYGRFIGDEAYSRRHKAVFTQEDNHAKALLEVMQNKI